MSRSLLQLVLRTTADVDGSDPDLLRRFVASRDEAAFAALVKRHGPLIWAVCRHLIPNRADAEDAFQATFLALARSAKSVRKPEQLAGWLHGAAVRIARKAKRGFVRRTVHERATARPEADAPVSASSWNEMLAAVHDEVAKLPRSLRAAFVLCDLEGVDATDAAGRLGVKANTLSGQLARARQRLLDALTKRGVGAGVVTFGTAVAVPQALADKAVGVIGVSPTALQSNVIELASEVTAMRLSKLKLLAAGFMVTCGLSLTGLGLMPNADGQPPGGSPGNGRPGGLTPGGPPGGGPGGVQPGGAAPKAFPGGETGALDGGDGGGVPGTGGMFGGTPKPAVAFEYLFVAKPGTLPEVAGVLRGKAAQNWEYTGPLDVDPSDPKTAPPKATEGLEGWTKDTRVVLVFKRAAAKPSGMPGMGGVTGGPGGMGMGGSNGVRSGRGMSSSGGMTPGGSVAGSNPLGMMAGMMGGGTGTAPGKAADLYEVFRLKNAQAEDAAKVLSEVFNGPGEGSGRVRVVAEKTSNSVIVTKASAADLKTIEALLKNALDVLPDGRRTKVFSLKHASASVAAEQVVSTFTDARGKGAAGDLTVNADARINALVVTGSAADLKEIEQLVAKLDVKPKVYSAMFKITEVAPSEAAKAWKGTLTDAALVAKFHDVEMVGADTFATLIVNAPTAAVLDDVRRWVREKYPKATEVKAGESSGR